MSGQYSIAAGDLALAQAVISAEVLKNDGISTPAIVHWPAELKRTPGEIVHQPAHLIDVMPTLADIIDCDVPQSWHGRELRPVSRVSLKPIFEAGLLDRLSPIHLLFSNDRGLRDGDWKAVSFRATAWEPN